MQSKHEHQHSVIACTAWSVYEAAKPTLEISPCPLIAVSSADGGQATRKGGEGGGGGVGGRDRHQGGRGIRGYQVDTGPKGSSANGCWFHYPSCIIASIHAVC